MTIKRDDIEHILRNEDYQHLVKSITKKKKLETTLSFIDRKKNLFYVNAHSEPSSNSDTVELFNVLKQILEQTQAVLPSYCPECGHALSSQTELRSYILNGTCVACSEKKRFKKNFLSKKNNIEEKTEEDKPFFPEPIQEIYGTNVPVYVIDELGNYFSYEKER